MYVYVCMPVAAPPLQQLGYDVDVRVCDECVASGCLAPFNCAYFQRLLKVHLLARQ